MFGSLPHLDFRLKLSSSRDYACIFWALFLNFTCGLGFFVLVFEMSDLYENNESGDMSSFLQFLFQNSSSSQHNHDGNRVSTSLFISGGINADSSSSSIHFSDPSPTSFLNGDSERMDSVKHVSGSTAEGSDSFDAAAPNSAPPRSSKRSRAAEVHNLSEKRRRSRINEKLKALQTLIPNANKTDKASVLDEAIEYLKQLQHQVQMLTVRNGLSLHTGYSLSTLQSMLSAPSVPEFHEGSARLNSTRVPEPQTREQNVFLQNVGETNVATSSTMPNFMTSTISRPISEFIPPTQSHYGLLNHLNSSKDICRDDTIFRLQLDLSCSGNNTSPGVSSS